MKDLYRISNEQIELITLQKNNLNRACRTVIGIVGKQLAEIKVGQKIRATSTNSFLKSIKIPTYGNETGLAYSLGFDSLGYLFLRVRGKFNHKEITILKTDDKGVVTKIWELKDEDYPIYNSVTQIETAAKIGELQKQIEELRKGLIYEIYN